MEVHAKECPVVEEEDIPSMQELVEQVESHTKVIDLDNSIPLNTPEGMEIAKNLLSPDAHVALVAVETPSTPLISG